MRCGWFAKRASRCTDGPRSQAQDATPGNSCAQDRRRQSETAAHKDEPDALRRLLEDNAELPMRCNVCKRRAAPSVENAMSR